METARASITFTSFPRFLASDGMDAMCQKQNTGKGAVTVGYSANSDPSLFMKYAALHRLALHPDNGGAEIRLRQFVRASAKLKHGKNVMSMHGPMDMNNSKPYFRVASRGRNIIHQQCDDQKNERSDGGRKYNV